MEKFVEIVWTFSQMSFLFLSWQFYKMTKICTLENLISMDVIFPSSYIYTYVVMIHACIIINFMTFYDLVLSLLSYQAIYSKSLSLELHTKTTSYNVEQRKVVFVYQEVVHVDIYSAMMHGSSMVLCYCLMSCVESARLIIC